MPSLRPKPRAPINCIYCGETKKASKEHVVQDAIGGWDVLWEVCQPCNESFSGIDENLSINSPLAILAVRELGETGPRSWTFTPDMPDLLLEARGGKGTDALALHAQHVFDKNKPFFCVDHEEIDLLGMELVQERFYTRLRNAYENYCIKGKQVARKFNKKKDILWLQQIERPLPGRRLPPRIFCKKPISQWDSSELTFELKFHKDGDDKRVLDKLSTFDWTSRVTDYKMQLGTHESTVNFPFSLTDFMRAMAKIGVNLLAFHCPSLAPSRATFARTIEWITERKHLQDFGDDRRFGFIHPADVASMNCPANAHMFRLMHDPAKNIWKMYAAFFGAQAAAYVEFFGPGEATWSTIDIVAPYEAKMLPAVATPWYVPMPVRTTINPVEMLPTVKWTSGHSTIEKRTPVI